MTQWALGVFLNISRTCGDPVCTSSVFELGENTQ